MAAIEGQGRSPTFAARRRHYGTQLKRQVTKMSALRVAMLRTATRADVVECYRTILGREPEHARVAEDHLLGQPLVRDVVAKLARSAELRTRNLYSNIAYERAREPNYLARSFGELQRVRAYFGHYGFLTGALCDPALDALISRKPTLYRHPSSPQDWRVVVTATHERHEEGELELQLLHDGAAVYVMGVTIVPGEIVGAPERPTLLISRMQGTLGGFLGVRQATKAFGDIHPKAVLLAALRGFAEALGIAMIAGVTSANQIACLPGKADGFAKIYDEFFVAGGATRLTDDFYFLPVGTERKAPTAASRAHARRAERRRRARSEIAEAAAGVVREWLRSSGALNPEGLAAAFDDGPENPTMPPAEVESLVEPT